MLRALDEIAGRHQLRAFAQTADPRAELLHIEHKDHLTPAEFRSRSAEAELLVGHAGVGTVLTAQRLNRPLVLFPRRADFKEHRNDHQVATARALEQVDGIYVAWTEADFEHLLTTSSLRPASMRASAQRQQLIQHLRSFLESVR